MGRITSWVGMEYLKSGIGEQTPRRDGVIPKGLKYVAVVEARVKLEDGLQGGFSQGVVYIRRSAICMSGSSGGNGNPR